MEKENKEKENIKLLFDIQKIKDEQTILLEEYNNAIDSMQLKCNRMKNNDI